MESIILFWLCPLVLQAARAALRLSVSITGSRFVSVSGHRWSPHVFDMAFCDCTCVCRIPATAVITCAACWKAIGNQCNCLLGEFEVTVNTNKKYREGFCHQCNWYDLPYSNRYFLKTYKSRSLRRKEEIARSPKPSKRKTDLKKAPST